ncbi:MAG: hypothetical protein GF341_13105, partial [candidate division Zixibacteria bacterium]|nr:hypothetical protein [candidate division Zixibacteria bacterium]
MSDPRLSETKSPPHVDQSKVIMKWVARIASLMLFAWSFFILALFSKGGLTHSSEAELAIIALLLIACGLPWIR